MLRSVLRGSYRFLNSKFAPKGHALIPVPPGLNEDLGGEAEANRIWYHAASVGELESLIPLILISAKKGHELIVTILSSSAQGTLKKLKRDLEPYSSKVLFMGFSPWEGQWSSSLRNLRPRVFITVKYEAWPDLWVSLREQDIPLVIIGARARRSLRIAKLISRALSGGIPKLILFPTVSSDAKGLEELFPDAIIEVTGDPRWDQVYSRVQAENPRVKELVGKCRHLKRPWGMVGNAWLEDLKLFQNRFHQIEGTLWVVPHLVKPENISLIQAFLSSCGLNLVLSANEADYKNDPNCVIVNEMGLLTELYSEADWAWVGGGFGVGIHSTIEPGLHGIPIAVGPNGTSKFPEVAELLESRQLTIVRHSDELSAWLGNLNLSRDPSKNPSKSKWVLEAQARLGAAERIKQSIESFLGERAGDKSASQRTI